MRNTKKVTQRVRRVYNFIAIYLVVLEETKLEDGLGLGGLRWETEYRVE
jgi:hypothetical protein